MQQVNWKARERRKAIKYHMERTAPSHKKRIIQSYKSLQSKFYNFPSEAHAALEERRS